MCRRIATLMRGFEWSVGPVYVQAVELAVKRRSADAKRLSRSRDISVCPRQSPLQNAALGLGEDFGATLRPTEQIGCGHRFVETLLRYPKRQASRSGGADHKVIGIDRDQRAGAFVGHRRQQNSRLRERHLEIFRFDPACGIDHGHRNKIGEGFGQIGPARRDVKRGDKIPLMIVDRSSGAASSVLRV